MDFFEIKDKDLLLDRLAADYPSLEKMLFSMDGDAIDFVPALPDAWSIREHVAHLLDNEVNCFIRYRKMISEPGVKLFLGSPNPAVRELLLYNEQPVGESVQLMKGLRGFIHGHLQKIKDRNWEDFRMDHPTMGDINLNMVLSIYVQHFEMHMEYIRRNADLFLKEEHK